MPTFRIYLDETQGQLSEKLRLEIWPQLRAAAMEHFGVPAGVCKLSVIRVENDPDNYPVNVEIGFLARPERNREKTAALCDAVFRAVSEGTGQGTFVGAAIRDPEFYVFRK